MLQKSLLQRIFMEGSINQLDWNKLSSLFTIFWENMSNNEYGGYSPPISSPTRCSRSHRSSSPPCLDYVRRNSSPTCSNYETSSSPIYKNRCDTTTLNITSNPLVHFDGKYAIDAIKISVVFQNFSDHILRYLCHV